MLSEMLKLKYCLKKEKKHCFLNGLRGKVNFFFFKWREINFSSFDGLETKMANIRYSKKINL